MRSVVLTYLWIASIQARLLCSAFVFQSQQGKTYDLNTSVSPPIFTRSRSGRPYSTELSVGAKLAILENWKVLTNGRVMGNVRSHPSIQDNEQITTSPLVRPEVARKNRVVLTISGSKYRLGTPAMAEELSITQIQKASNSVPVNGASSPAIKVSLPELQRKARLEKQLTGEVIGDDTRQYLLAGTAQKSTSGKSKIFQAYKANSDGLPEGDPVTVKLSANWEALEREASNYNRITKAGVTRGQFVMLLDYLPTASVITKRLSPLSALVLERGSIDLKKYIGINGPLEGKELRDAAAAAAQCLQAIHNSGLVWTDLKTENFIVTKEGQVKGIDLESAMPVKDNPVDYSPEATPPEFATAFLDGDGPYFTLEYSYDLWSFGMMLFELSTGSGYWDGKTPVQITKALRDQPVIDLKNVDIDPKLKDLIAKCLSLDPKKRPTVVQMLLHPYFITTGIGPFSFSFSF